MVSARELTRFLLRQGYHRARQTGSHLILEHPICKTLVIPIHAGDLPKGLFLTWINPANRHVRDKIRQQLQILRDLGLVQFLDGGDYRLP